MSQEKIIKMLGIESRDAQRLRQQMEADGLEPSGSNTAWVLRSALYGWLLLRDEDANRTAQTV